MDDRPSPADEPGIKSDARFDRNTVPPPPTDSFSRWLPLYRLIGFILVAFVLVDTLLTATRGTKGDLDVFVHAARVMLEGGNFYDIPNRLGIFYLYPPLFAFLCIPLTFIPIDLAIVLWGISTVALIGWSILMFYKAMTGRSLFSLPPRTRWIIAGGSLLLVVRFIHTHLMLSQANVLILAASIAVVFLSSRKQELPAGILLGIAGMIKLFVYPLGVHFLARKNRQVIAWSVVGLAVAVLIPSFVLGFDRNLLMHQDWVEKVILQRGPASDKWINTYNLSLQAQFFRFFADIPSFHHGTSRYFFTIWKAPVEFVTALNWLALLLVPVAVTVFAFKFRNLPALLSTWGSIAFAFSLMPLSSPIAQEHHFVLLLPSCIYVIHLLMEHALRDWWFRGSVAAFFLLTQLTSPLIWGEFLSECFIALGFVTFGALFLSVSIVRAAFVLKAGEPPAIRQTI